MALRKPDAAVGGPNKKTPRPSGRGVSWAMLWEEPAGLAVDRDDVTVAVDALETPHLLEVVGDLEGLALLVGALEDAGFSEPRKSDHDVLAVVDIDELYA